MAWLATHGELCLPLGGINKKLEDMDHDVWDELDLMSMSTKSLSFANDVYFTILECETSKNLEINATFIRVLHQ